MQVAYCGFLSAYRYKRTINLHDSVLTFHCVGAPLCLYLLSRGPRGRGIGFECGRQRLNLLVVNVADALLHGVSAWTVWPGVRILGKVK